MVHFRWPKKHMASPGPKRNLKGDRVSDDTALRCCLYFEVHRNSCKTMAFHDSGMVIQMCHQGTLKVLSSNINGDPFDGNMLAGGRQGDRQGSQDQRSAKQCDQRKDLHALDSMTGIDGTSRISPMTASLFLSNTTVTYSASKPQPYEVNWILAARGARMATRPSPVFIHASISMDKCQIT